MIRPIVLVIRDERDMCMTEASVPASSKFGGGEACVRDLASLHSSYLRSPK